MLNTSSTYKDIIKGAHVKECKLNIAGTDYGEDYILSMSIDRGVFPEDKPAVGGCVSATIEIEMFSVDIPRTAELRPYYRVKNSVETSEWIPKGVFYVDTRTVNKVKGTVRLTGYDSMLQAERDFPGVSHSWPSTDIQVLNDIAAQMGVGIDDRTIARMTKGYAVQLPTNYTSREVLGFLAAMYGGDFVMSDNNELLLVSFTDIPAETSYLISEDGDAITFGGVRILV